MTELSIQSNWEYFKYLVEQLHQTERYVDHSRADDGRLLNGETCSMEFAKIIMLAASEFEVIAKELCKESGSKLPWNASIITISERVLQLYPRITETYVRTPRRCFKPLQEWRVLKKTDKNGKKKTVCGISWWSAYTSIKHDRISSIYKANLENAINSMASLMVMELYLSKKALGNVFRIGVEKCSYFSCDYWPSVAYIGVEKELPDFEQK